MADADLLKQEVLWRKFSQSATEFFFGAWKIEVPGKSPELPERREAQEEAMNMFQSERYLLCLKARQIGWTTLGAAFAAWGAVTSGTENRRILLLSRTEREAVKLLKRVSFGYRHLPEWLKGRGPKLEKSTTLKMEFDNGCIIEALPSKNDPARGESAWLVIVDEWAFLDNPSEAWASIEPATDVGGRVIGFSTANGYGSWFHTFYMRGKAGLSNFTTLFFSWRAVPGRDEKWLESKIQTVSDEDAKMVAQEYAEDDVSCWLKSGNMFFDPMSLAEPGSTPDPVAFMDLRMRESSIEVYALESAEGMLALYQPRSKSARYVIGADVASGSPDGDWSVAQIIDRESGVLVGTWRARVDPDDFGSHLYMLGMYFNEAFLGVESNNHGLATLIALQGFGYKNLYFDRPHLRRVGAKPQQRKVGWHTTEATKSLMLHELKSALQSDILEITDAQTNEELWSYQQITLRQKNGRQSTKYAGSPHDDCVMALAIAYQMMKYAKGGTSAPENEPGKEPGRTFAQWAELDSIAKYRRVKV